MTPANGVFYNVVLFIRGVRYIFRKVRVLRSQATVNSTLDSISILYHRVLRSAQRLPIIRFECYTLLAFEMCA